MKKTLTATRRIEQVSAVSEEKKLKKNKHRIVLPDGQELQYHNPRKTERSLSLVDFLPNTYEKLEVEIGCGKGEFISKRAAGAPSTFFVGIDRRQDRFLKSEKRMKRLAEDQNWSVLREDARCFVDGELPPIDILHVYHPDPWPKARHHKHRFFRSPVAKRWSQALRDGGQLRISSDHREYFEEILSIVQSWGQFELQLLLRKEAFLGEGLSQFERIFLQKKEPVFKAYFLKKGLKDAEASRPEDLPNRRSSFESSPPS